MRWLAFNTLLIVLVAVALSQASAQQYPLDNKRDYVWCFGYEASPPYFGRTVVDFKTSPPDTTYVNVWHDIDIENVSMCDTGGNLIFYCNGNDIYGANHEIIESGDSINCCGVSFEDNYGLGYPYLQGMIALPAPGFQDRYYLVYKPYDFLGATTTIISTELRYTAVEKDLSNNTYKVTDKEQVFQTGLFDYGELTACRHANGRDWWILQRKYLTNFFRVFLLSPSGISLHHNQTVGDSMMDHFGQALFTFDGSKYIISGVSNDLDNADTFLVAVYDFDRCSGMLSNQVQYVFKDSVSLSAGCAVSPNSRYLYLSNHLKVFQFDLLAPDWTATKTLVATNDGFTELIDGSPTSTPFGWMQLAPDGRIYMIAGNTRYLHTIDSPDIGGASCNVNQHSFRLSSLNLYSIPNFPNYRLGPIDGSACDTLGIDVVDAVAFKPVSSTTFNLFPNPGSDYFDCSFSSTVYRQAAIDVYDALGRKLLSVPVQQGSTRVATKTLPTGVYIVKLVSNSEQIGALRWVKM
jgi:hypothetical protein